MNPQAIRQLQTSLGLPATGVLDTATTSAMNSAIAKAVSTNKDVTTYAASNDPTAILNAYMTGDWSGVVSLTGKPFTDEQQKAAVAQAEQALAPAYRAQEEYDTAATKDALKTNAEGLSDFQKTQATQFGRDKNALDQSAADQGVLFTGSRVQKQNDLRTSYSDAEARAVRDAAERAATTARGYQYDYGNGGVGRLGGLYSVPGASTYDASVAGGKVTPNKSLSAVYNPSQYSFQGTKPVAQQAAIQSRAASLLANRANKLSLSGVGAKF